MSISSLAKFSNVLGAVTEKTRSAAPPADPTEAILLALRDGMIPVTDLTDRTRLPSQTILDAVERLRSREQVEIIVRDGDSRKYIRLTPAGYAVFAAS